MPNSAILWYLFLQLFALLVIAILILRMRSFDQTSSRRMLLIFFAISVVILASSLLSMITSNIRVALFFHQTLRLSAMILFPPVYLLFLLTFSESALVRKPVFQGIFFFWAITNVIIIFSNPLHSLYTSSYTLARFGPFFLRTAWEPGAWFNIAAIISYAALLVGVIYCVVKIFNAKGTYRIQYALFLVATLIPVSLSFLDTYQVVPPEFQLSTLGIAAMGVILFWSMHGFRFMDVLPVAWATVVDSIDDVVIVIDDRLMIRALNPAATATLAITHKSIGANITALLDNNQHLVELVTTMMSGRTEIEIHRDSGDLEYYDLTISKIGKRTKNNGGRVLILRNIDERKQAESERELLVQELQAYAHTVAHNIKSPLAVLYGFLELALEMDVDIPELRDYLTYSHNMAIKTNEIVDNLLLFASLRDESMTITFQKLEMQEIVESAIHRLSVSDNGGDKAQIILPEQWPEALGYGPWIEEVWANYLNNAAKYGEQPLVIELGGTAETDDYVRYWVRNSGPEIPADKIKGLFTPWNRINPSVTAGHGLGLSICRRIIERHRGQVGVESDSVNGTTFYFTLPAVR